MAGTLAAEVRKVLLANIGDLDDFWNPSVDGMTPSVSVRWPLDKSLQTAEMVFTEGPVRFTHTPASLKAGRTFRNEQATFDVVIRVEGIDKSQEETTDRCVELGTTFEEYVADNRTGLAVDGLNWVVIDGDGQLEELWNERGHLALLTYPVKYDARLT